MNTEKKFTKIKQLIKKIGTRNLVVICAVLLIGTAIGINYILYRDQANSPSTDVDIDLSDKDFNDMLNNDPNSSD